MSNPQDGLSVEEQRLATRFAENRIGSGDTGRGVGASHQTGWRAFVPLCLKAAHRLLGESNTNRIGIEDSKDSMCSLSELPALKERHDGRS